MAASLAEYLVAWRAENWASPMAECLADKLVERTVAQKVLRLAGQTAVSTAGPLAGPLAAGKVPPTAGSKAEHLAALLVVGLDTSLAERWVGH